MRAGLQNVVLEIVLMIKQYAFGLGLVGKRFQAIPIPCVRTGQVVFAQPVPSLALTGTAERLLVERRPHIAVAAADALMEGSIAQLTAESGELAESVAALDVAYKAADDAVWAAVEALQADVGDLNGQIEALQGADGAIVWVLSALTAASIVIGAVGLILAIRAGKKR